MSNTAPTFTNANGTMLHSLGAKQISVINMALQADGGIVVVGTMDGNLLLQRFLSNGQLDPAFSSSGAAELNRRGLNFATDVQVQPDGKLLVSGGTNLARTDATRDLAMARLNPDGSLDTSFSDDGWLSMDLGGRESLARLQLQADGKIVAVGYTRKLGTSDYDQLMFRFQRDGSLDASFDGDGLLRVNLATSELAVAPLLQKDGKLVLVGEGDNGAGAGRVLYMTRLLAGGQLDTSFGGTGVIKVDLGQTLYVNDAQLQPNGKIVVLGSLYDARIGVTSVVTLRFNADGSADTTFGEQGVVSYAGSGSYNNGQAMVLQQDGKILITGVAGSNEAGDLGVLRLNADGSRDLSFGSQGLALNDAGGSDVGMALALRADGTIVVAGQSSLSFSSSGALVLERLLPNGQLDTSLAGQGTLGNVPTAVEHGAAVVLEPQVRIYDAELAATSYDGARLLLQRHGGVQYGDLFLGPGGQFLSEGQYLYVDGRAVARVAKASGGQLDLSFMAGASQDRVNGLLQSLSYVNANEVASATVQIDWLFSDGNSGAQGSGGALSAVGSTMVKLVGVDDLPMARDTVLKVLERAPYTLQAADFGFYDAEDGAALSAVQFLGAPQWGVLKVNGHAVSGTLTVSAAEINAGLVTYQSRASSPEYDSVAFRVMDSSKQLSGKASLLFSVAKLDVMGSNLDDVLTGTAGHDNLYGFGGNDTLNGMGGDDYLSAGSGANILNGGDGFDTALYTNRYYPGNVSIGASGGKVFVSDSSADGVADVLTGIERLVFANMSVALDTAGAGGQAYRIYQAAFDRKPDAAGLGFWISRLDSGANLREVAQGFVDSAEFKTVFGASPDPASLVSGLYQHVLHRAPEPAGYDYWLKVLTERPNALAEVLAAFSESPENQSALIGVIGQGMPYIPYG